MEKLKMEVALGARTKVLATASRSNSRLNFGSDMRPFFAILGLLLCLIAARADELPVIKDSEAVQYLGKNVEVRGLLSP